MAANFGRWIKYAQAKLQQATSASHAELDQLEAEREAELADQPWLRSDADAPTFDEARARIEWEAEEQRRREVASDSPPPLAGEPTTGEGRGEVVANDPEQVAARVELDRRTREAGERLDAIRKELGVEPPKPDGG